MSSPTLRIATYNINGIRPRLGALLEWLKREAPDVVCLQELKTPDEGFPAEDIHDAGYGAIWLGQKSWNGVAILARGAQPVERRRGLPGDHADTQSRYLEADIHGLVVGCLYLPNGNPRPGPKFDYKLAWFERLIEHARTLRAARVPVVLAGDYNVVPTDSDIYDPRNWRKDALLQPESRAAYQRLLDQGWTDALRARYPDERIYTFWDYFRQHWPRNAGLRIDHLLLSDELAPRLVDAGVDRWVRDRPSPSDHAPTWVTLAADAGGTARTGEASRGDMMQSAQRPDTAGSSKRVRESAVARKTVATTRAKSVSAAAGPRGSTAAKKASVGARGAAKARDVPAGVANKVTGASAVGRAPAATGRGTKTGIAPSLPAKSTPRKKKVALEARPAKPADRPGAASKPISKRTKSAASAPATASKRTKKAPSATRAAGPPASKPPGTSRVALTANAASPKARKAASKRTPSRS